MIGTQTGELTAVEVRVLGCLVEKELTTPEYYPLSLHALTTACNQKTNRDPVVDLGETEVVRGLDRLRSMGLVAQDTEGVRVPKYLHNLKGKLQLAPQEIALLGELWLRGPQTVGELRGRAERMHSFEDLATVERVLDGLIAREPPLVVKLPRQPGRKEHRYMHLFGGEPHAKPDASEVSLGTATSSVRAEDERIARLEAEVTALREELAAVRRELEAFKAQFD